MSQVVDIGGTFIFLSLHNLYSLTSTPARTFLIIFLSFASFSLFKLTIGIQHVPESLLDAVAIRQIIDFSLSMTYVPQSKTDFIIYIEYTAILLLH